MKMASYYPKSCGQLNTLKIETTYEYELIRNLYSRLVEYNLTGELVPSLATGFKWENGELIFSFGDKVKSQGGHIFNWIS